MEDQNAALFSKLDDAARHFVGRNPGKTKQQKGEPEPAPGQNPTQQLWQQRQWLHEQIVEHQGALNAAQDNTPAPSNTVVTALENDLENLQMRVGNLQTELVEAASNASLRDFLVQQNQLSCTLSKTLDEQAPDRDGTTKRVKELIAKQAELGSAVLRIQQEIENLTPQLDKVKAKNLALLRSSRELMWNIQQAKDAGQKTPQKDKELKRMQDRYDIAVLQIKIMRNVLQGLILGSGVNWAADEQLKDTVISLGSPLDEQLQQP